MKFIQVTGPKGGKIYVNPEHIGHMYEYEEKNALGEMKKLTNVGVITHNNGGFSVKESIYEILEKIKKA